MISALLLFLFCHLLIVLAGTSAICLLRFRVGRSFWLLVPYAWAVGALIVYAVARILLFVRVEAWNYILLVVLLALVACALGPRLRREGLSWFNRVAILVWQPLAGLIHALRYGGFQVAFIAFFVLIIAIKIAIIGVVATADPIVISDATLKFGYVPLTQKLAAAPSLPEIFEKPSNLINSLGVPLVNGWILSFQHRWLQGLLPLTWLLTQVFILWIAISTCYQMSRNGLAAVVLGYMLSVVPLAAVHIMRPGYHDLVLGYAFCAALSLLLLRTGRIAPLSAVPPIVIVAIAAFMGTIKLEGLAWGAYLLVVMLSFHLRNRYGVIYRQFVVLGVIVAIVFVLTFFVDAKISSRIDRIFNFYWGFDALLSFLEQAFIKNSFGLWWYLFATLAAGLASMALLSRLDSNQVHTLICMVGVFLVLSYISSFTGDAPLTLKHLNPGRFLLHIQAIAIPLYCLWAQILPGSDRGGGTKFSAPLRDPRKNAFIPAVKSRRQ